MQTITTQAHDEYRADLDLPDVFEMPATLEETAIPPVELPPLPTQTSPAMAEHVVYLRLAELELKGCYPPEFSEICFDTDDLAALCRLGAQGLVVVNIADHCAYLTDDGLAKYETLFPGSTRHLYADDAA